MGRCWELLTYQRSAQLVFVTPFHACACDKADMQILTDLHSAMATGFSEVQYWIKTKKLLASLTLWLPDIFL